MPLEMKMDGDSYPVFFEPGGRQAGIATAIAGIVGELLALGLLARWLWRRYRKVA